MLDLMQLSAIITQVQYWIKRAGVSLHPNTGLELLIKRNITIYENQQKQLPLASGDHYYMSVLTLLYDTLHLLWKKNIDFTSKLKAMNTGSVDFGESGEKGKDNFKDFGFELVSAYLLLKNVVNAQFPSDEDNNDIICTIPNAVAGSTETIEIQCKHPEVLHEGKIQDFIGNALKHSTQTAQETSTPANPIILGFAVDGVFPFVKVDDYFSLHSHFKTIEASLIDAFTKVQIPTRVLGFYTLATAYNNEKQKIEVFGNAVIINHSGISIKEKQEPSYKAAYTILSCFNPIPNIFTVDNETPISYNKMKW